MSVPVHRIAVPPFGTLMGALAFVDGAIALPNTQGDVSPLVKETFLSRYRHRAGRSDGDRTTVERQKYRDAASGLSRRGVQDGGK